MKAITYFKKYFNNVQDDEITFTESSGSSVVLFINIKEFNITVFQYYISEQEVNSINEMYDCLKKKNTLILDFNHGWEKQCVNEIHSITYNSMDYIVEKIDILGSNMIVWERIYPLTTFSEKEMNKILENNYHKLLWDISKALSAIHESGYIHDDCCIDNIGLSSRGNFVLFDFNMSRRIDENNQPRKDFYSFLRSIRFRYKNENKTDRIYEQIFIQTVVYKLAEELKKTNLETIDYLEKLKLNL